MKFCPQCGEELTEAPVAGKKRKKCPSCDFIFWNNPTPVIAAIVEHEGSVVLIRNRGWPEKLFGIVTGFLEEGETPEEGALREVKEELNLEGRSVSFVGYYPFFEMNQIILAFHILAEGEMVVGDELAEIKRVSPDRLKPKPFGTGKALQDWLLRRGTEATRPYP
jgi:NAD+ diphosphatase